MPFSEHDDCFTRLFHLPRFGLGAGRLFHTWANMLFSYANTAFASCRDASAFYCYLQIPWFDTLWSLLLNRNRTFPSTVFSTYTMEEIWHHAHGAQQRCCPSYRCQRNTTKSHHTIDSTSHSQLFRTFLARSRTSIILCADNPFSFYFSIQMDSEPYPCWQAGLRFERDPIFSLTHFHSVKWPIPRVISAVIMMALTSIHTTSLFLCLFILTYCLPVDPHHGDNMTDVDQSVLACIHTFND